MPDPGRGGTVVTARRRPGPRARPAGGPAVRRARSQPGPRERGGPAGRGGRAQPSERPDLAASSLDAGSTGSALAGRPRPGRLGRSPRAGGGGPRGRPRTSSTERPRIGAASRSRRPAADDEMACGTPRPAHSSASPTSCGVPNRRSNRAADSASRSASAPGSSNEKMPPPSSLTTTTVRSGRSSRGPSTSAPRSCRNARSPTSTRDGPAAAQPDADGGRDGAVDAGQAAVGVHQTVPGRPGPGPSRQIQVAHRVRRRQHEGIVRPGRGRDLARDERPGQHRPAVQDRVHGPRRRPPGPLPARQPRGAVRRRRGRPGEPRLDLLRIHPPYVGPLGAGRAGRSGEDDLDVGAVDQPGDRPRQGRSPEDDDLLDPATQVGPVQQQAIGPDRVGSAPRA